MGVQAERGEILTVSPLRRRIQKAEPRTLLGPGLWFYVIGRQASPRDPLRRVFPRTAGGAFSDWDCLRNEPKRRAAETPGNAWSSAKRGSAAGGGGAAAVIVAAAVAATAAAAVTAAAAAAPAGIAAAAAPDNDEQDDDPAAVASAKASIAHKMEPPERCRPFEAASVHHMCPGPEGSGFPKNF